MTQLLSSPAAAALVQTLIHFVWQGLLVVLAGHVVFQMVGHCASRLRYAVLLAAFGLMMLCPLLTFAVVFESPAVKHLPAAVQGGSPGLFKPAVAAGGQRVSLPYVPETLSERLPSASSGRPLPGHDMARWTETGAESVMVAARPWILITWLAGVMLSGARLLAGLTNVYWLRRGHVGVPAALKCRAGQMARAMGLAATRVLASERIREAAVVGFFRPVVLLPTSWLTALPVDVLEAVIAHELAHIRRHDVWVNLMQRIVETLLFYHPAVWWLSNRIRVEREMCCDELAVAATGERGQYVLALEQVGRLQVRGTLKLATSFTGDRRMNLLSRIQHVLQPNHRPDREPAWLVGIVAVALPLLVLGTTGLLGATGSAVAQERGNSESVESEEGERRSAEAETGERRSPERETGERRSVEREEEERAERGKRDERRERGDRRSEEEFRERRSADVERDGERRRDGESRGRRDGQARDADVFFANEREVRDRPNRLEEFRPQTDREAVLLQMIQQLQREVAALRREMQVRGDRGGDWRDGDRSRFRDGEGRRDDEARRDGDFRREDRGRDSRDRSTSLHTFELPERWQQTREGRVFQAYDKNGDLVVSLDEWLEMTNGTASPQRREVQTERFRAAEPSGDGRFTPAEFIWWYGTGRSEAIEQQRRTRDGDGDPFLRGRRDRESERRGPRDGERESDRPRDGETERTGDRDGDGRESGPRDGDRERR